MPALDKLWLGGNLISWVRTSLENIDCFRFALRE